MMMPEEDKVWKSICGTAERPAPFKAMARIREDKAIAELASEFEVRPKQIRNGKDTSD